MLDGDKCKGENNTAGKLPEDKTLETFNREPSKDLADKSTLE